jgi:hypothetical protein
MRSPATRVTPIFTQVVTSRAKCIPDEPSLYPRLLLPHLRSPSSYVSQSPANCSDHRVRLCILQTSGVLAQSLGQRIRIQLKSTSTTSIIDNCTRPTLTYKLVISRFRTDNGEASSLAFPSVARSHSDAARHSKRSACLSVGTLFDRLQRLSNFKRRAHRRPIT